VHIGVEQMSLPEDAISPNLDAGSRLEHRAIEARVRSDHDDCIRGSRLEPRPSAKREEIRSITDLHSARPPDSKAMVSQDGSAKNDAAAFGQAKPSDNE